MFSVFYCEWNIFIFANYHAFIYLLHSVTTFSELGLYLTFIPRIDHYLPFHHSQTSSFSIQGSICEPQGCRHMLDKAHGLSILNLWNAHPLNITLLSHLHLLLLGGEKDSTWEKNWSQWEKKSRILTMTIQVHWEIQIKMLTFEARKQKADSLVFAFSGSTTKRPFSSSRHRYRPVVMWRIRKDCPHFMWLPLQLHKVKEKNYKEAN